MSSCLDIIELPCPIPMPVLAYDTHVHAHKTYVFSNLIKETFLLPTFILLTRLLAMEMC